MTKLPAGKLQQDGQVEQWFTAHPGPAILSIRFSTYCSVIGGQLQISLGIVQMPSPKPAQGRSWRKTLKTLFKLAARDGPAGKRNDIHQFIVLGEDVEDNAFLDFQVDLPTLPEGSVFSILITTTNTSKTSAPTVWLTDDNDAIPGRVACFVNNAKMPGLNIEARFFYTPLITNEKIPAALSYSPVTQCNMNCIHCISKHTRKSLRIIPESVKARMQAWARNGELLALGTDYSGDILWADSRFGSELDFILSLDILFHISTNGAYLSDSVIQKLIQSKLHSIDISLDAATEETYRKIRIGAPPLQAICNNIKSLVNSCQSSSSDIRISMSFTLMKSNIDEWLYFIRLADRLGVKIVVCRHVEIYDKDLQHESLWFQQEQFNDIRLKAIELAASLGVSLAAPAPFLIGTLRHGHRACQLPWQTALLLGNGDVLACVVPGMKMGNLHEQTMEEIWNGEAYRTLRATVNTSAAPTPCQSCPVNRFTNNPKSYLHFDLTDSCSPAGP